MLALVTGKFKVSIDLIATSIVLAAGSNNFVKAGCAAILGRNRQLLPAIAWLLLLFAASVAYAFVIS